MRGDRYARHSAIVEVESDTDKSIEQRQASGGRMFTAHTQAKKRQTDPKWPPRMPKKGLFFSSFSEPSPTELAFPATE